MANGFDRLERLFSSKRKLSTEPCEPASPPVQNPEQTFPAPTFIRPKANRMAAREEVSAKQTCQRSGSVSTSLSIRGDVSISNRQSTSAGSFASSGPPSLRTSIMMRHNDPLIAGLNDYQFPRPPSRSGELSPRSSSSRKNSLALDSQRPMSPRSKPPPVRVMPMRVDTPPSSEPDEDCEPRLLQSSEVPVSQVGAPPTPGSSPDLVPTLDPRVRDSKISDILEKDIGETDEIHTGEVFEGSSRPQRYSDLSFTSSRHDSVCSSTLREPDFNDFLNLSDDDIAEIAPESPTIPPSDDLSRPLPSMELSISSARPRLSSFLTLTPPRASRPATAAAFEAARIASRYNFDLVYVVNLWPDKPTIPSFSGATRPGIEKQDANSQRPLIGRLLAAHGLHHVPSPLQISSSVHSTILRAEGWVEYQNPAAETNDLARGYACAFYTGQYAKGGSVDANAPVSGVRLSEQINRGIVFAAYRKPRQGDCKLGTDLKEEELGNLYGEAEALVEMLIDIHVTNRLRQPLTPTRLTDDIGPMPSGQLKAAQI